VGGDSRQVVARCGCGGNLEYDDTGWSLGDKTIRQVCPECGTAFRPQDQIADIVDQNGNKTPLPGGMCYRFAIVIDCSKDHPLYVRDENGQLIETKPKISGGFMGVCSAALGIKLKELGHWY
jgi:hypothetical protein